MNLVESSERYGAHSLLDEDLLKYAETLLERVKDQRFLIVGGAGTIGSAVSIEIAKRKPAAIHLVDISENNLVEAVRLMRSSVDFDAELRTYAVDVDSEEFDALISKNSPYDYILNLSALKHVRSEKDPFTLSRLIKVNIFNATKLVKIASRQKVKKYFCVSTDKAANPANIMGASKRLMELFVLRDRDEVSVSFARFANVLFSDGSLTYGFAKRFERKQPITAPNDIKRYFISATEAGQLCLLSTLLGDDLDIFFPKLYKDLNEKTFKELAIEFLRDRGFEAFNCSSEKEALIRCDELIAQNHWPCHFFQSDTSGEKSFEEFHTSDEIVDLEQFSGVGLVKVRSDINVDNLSHFEDQLRLWRESGEWDREKLINIFKETLPELQHIETGKNLDQRM